MNLVVNEIKEYGKYCIDERRIFFLLVGIIMVIESFFKISEMRCVGLNVILKLYIFINCLEFIII